MAKKIIIPNDEGILWKPNKDPKKKQAIDPITGKRLGKYGKMPKKVVFFEEVHGFYLNHENGVANATPFVILI